MDKLFNFPLLLVFTLCTTFPIFCSCHNSSIISCIEGERQTLLKLKQSFHDPFHRLSSWKGNNCCIWKGVSCNGINGHIVKLNLRAPSRFIHQHRIIILERRTSLVAHEVNSCLLELRYLKHLDLSGNDFQYSPIPPFFGSMKHLTYLNISNAKFNGSIPDNLGNLTGLRVLDLSNDQGPPWDLSCDNMLWISNLSSLQYLGLATIDLSETPNLFQVLNKLPFLTSLHLSQCGLNSSHFSWHFINSTFNSLRYLDLSRNNFALGSVPVALQNITSLRVLDLSESIFTNSIPDWFGNLKNLVHLNLAVNGFSSIEKGLLSILGNLCHLKSLDLSYNQLEGEKIGTYFNLSGCFGHDLEILSLDYSRISGHIPDWLWNLKNLTHLDLSHNQLNGTIPESLGQLPNLKTLDFSHNQLNGTIPESLGQLSNLETLDLSHNSLEGFISEVHFAALSKLKVLTISSNSLTINMKSNWIPPFQLEYIEMDSCKFQTSQFPQWLQTQLKTTTLLLSNTSISGTLPNWIKDMNHVQELDLSDNQINGSLPNFPSTLQNLDISNNMVSGALPEDIGDILPRLSYLILSDNLMNGPIPNSLCHVKTLIVLELSNNTLFGKIPDCWSVHQEIEVFDLSSNNLSGVIPSSVGNLHFLSWLDLSKNNLKGELPLSLRNCKYLRHLDLGENALSGNVPKWIGDSFSSLEILRLRTNGFNGTIPLQLCQLSFDLRILDLAENNLRGKIPHCFGNFTGMIYHPYSFYAEKYNQLLGWDDEHLTEVMKGGVLEYKSILSLLVNLDLSRNKLEGQIPEELTLLTALIGLNLSHNQLTGMIPKKIGELEWLESLDLSENELSGQIPDSMSSLTKLSHLNLSNNNLSGKIPGGKQLQTLDDPSIYAGNPLLCGASLLKKCRDFEKPEQDQDNEENNGEDNSSEKIWFYIVIMSGFATGFWGVVGSLIFKKSWRHAYFQFVDRSKEWLIVHVALEMASFNNMIKGNLRAE